MTDIGFFAGHRGLDRLLAETDRILAGKGKVIVALAGPPGCGKTFIVKNFTRYGFGFFPRSQVKVIDDNIVYTTKFWRLHWEKIKLSKETWRDFVKEQKARIIFFSLWRPSRIINFADIIVNVSVDEAERILRLGKRYPADPDKIRIQQAKTSEPIVEPFTYDIMMTYSDPRGETRRWAIAWMVKRLSGRAAGRTGTFQEENRGGNDRRNGTGKIDKK